jgi:hypothetical protein
MKKCGYVLSVIIAILFILLLGCEKKERYSIEQGKDGRVYRLDRETGEMAVVTGEKLIGISTPEKQINEKKYEADLAQEKNWPDRLLPAPYNLSCGLKTSWREGKMYYIFSVSPVKQTSVNAEGKPTETSSSLASKNWEWRDQYIGNLSNHIAIHMNDNGGFKLTEINVPFYTLIRTVDDKGEPSHIQNEGNVQCTSEIYKALTDWSLQWNLTKVAKDTKDASKKKRLRF